MDCSGMVLAMVLSRSQRPYSATSRISLSREPTNNWHGANKARKMNNAASKGIGQDEETSKTQGGETLKTQGGESGAAEQSAHCALRTESLGDESKTEKRATADNPRLARAAEFVGVRCRAKDATIGEDDGIGERRGEARVEPVVNAVITISAAAAASKREGERKREREKEREREKGVRGAVPRGCKRLAARTWLRF
eukprot:4031894-Pleurochrysis_carterae.AAC.1